MVGPWQSDNTLRSRYECKYLIDEGLAQEINSFVSPFVQPDFFALRGQNNSYAVNSLYLDSLNHELYHSTIHGNENRFKLRIRGYSSDPDAPLFVEVKRRANSVILKSRALVSRQAMDEFLRGAPLSPDVLLDNPEFKEFQSLVLRIAARPVVYVGYIREAYEVDGAEPVRITFDRQLRNAECATLASFDFDSLPWQETPCEKVVLEIKYTDAYPSWAEQLVREFQLDKCSVAKYVMCLEAANHYSRRQLHHE